MLLASNIWLLVLFFAALNWLFCRLRKKNYFVRFNWKHRTTFYADKSIWTQNYIHFQISASGLLLKCSLIRKFLLRYSSKTYSYKITIVYEHLNWYRDERLLSLVYQFIVDTTTENGIYKKPSRKTLRNSLKNPFIVSCVRCSNRTWRVSLREWKFKSCLHYVVEQMFHGL